MRASKIKSILRNFPATYAALRSLKECIAPRRPFLESATYWEERYRLNGDSGDGSYGRLAEFKAKVLNEFFSANGITTVTELGCGDGSQLSLLKCNDYVGVDVSETVLRMVQKRFFGDKTKKFLSYDEFRSNPCRKADAAVSLDVVYHLVEDSVFEDYMKRLFESATRWVVIYSSNKDEETRSPHVRHREFVKWIELNTAGAWGFVEKIDQQYPESLQQPGETSFADFYIFRKTKCEFDV